MVKQAEQIDPAKGTISDILFLPPNACSCFRGVGDSNVIKIPESRFPESQKQVQMEFKPNAILQIPGI
jgi:hypothetical protein